MPFKAVTRRGQVYYVPGALPVPPEHSDAALAGPVGPSDPGLFVASWALVPGREAPGCTPEPSTPAAAPLVIPETSFGAKTETAPAAMREHRARRRRGGG